MNKSFLLLLLILTTNTCLAQQKIYEASVDDTSKVSKSFDFINRAVFEDTVTQEFLYEYNYKLISETDPWIVYYDANKKVKAAERFFKDNHQIIIYYFPSGKKQKEIHHEIPTNYQKFQAWNWYPDGTKKIEMTHKPNNDTVNMFYYFPSGHLFKFERTVGERPSSMYAERWCDNGQLIHKGTFKYFGEMNNITHYHCNGKIKAQFHIFSGTPTGKWQEWYDNGQMKSDREYEEITQKSDGSFPETTKIGKWSYWDEKGKLTKEEFYENGKLVKETRY